MLFIYYGIKTIYKSLENNVSSIKIEEKQVFPGALEN